MFCWYWGWLWRCSRRMMLLTTMMTMMLVLPQLQEAGAATAPQYENGREYCQFEDFNATCGRGEVIMMQYADFGRKRAGTCIRNPIGYVGCSVSVFDLVDSTCSGKRHCSFEVASLRDYAKPCPEDLVVHLEADYKCLKVSNEGSDEAPSDGGNRCGRGRAHHITESGFLSSLATRPGDSGSESCALHLRAKPGQHLNFTLFNFSSNSRSYTNKGGLAASNLGSSTSPANKRCSLYAVIMDGAREHQLSLCGDKQRTSHLYISRSSAVRIHFTTKGQSQIKDYNVIIEYKVSGCPDFIPPSNMWVERFDEKVIVKCNHSQETWYLTCEGTNWLGSVTNCSESQPFNGPHRAPHRFPFGLIIAITIGVVLGVTVGTVMLVSVFVYRRRRRRCRRPVKSNTLLGDETSQENDENYARRLMQDYSRGPGSPGHRQCPHGSALHHHYHGNPSDYAQMLELRCASAPISNSIYSERRPLASSQPSLPAMAGISLQKLGGPGGSSSSSFATFKPVSGPYDKENTYESRKTMRTLPEHENRFIFDAEPDGPLSPDQQPDLVPNNHSDTPTKELESRGSAALSDTCSRHFSLYGQHKQQQPTVNRVSNI